MAKDGAAGKEEDNLLKEQVYQRRCATLLETMDTKSKLQSFSVLNFSSNENLAEFLAFLKKYMKFTEE
jgi:uroporphyrinogen-III synthase